MSIFKIANSLSLFDIFLCIKKKIQYRLLAHRYGFDLWHAKSPFECRSYKREVVDLAESLNPKTVIEVGCGLGEIVSRIRDCRRFGFDIDSRVIVAARELNSGSDIQFECAALSNIDVIFKTLDDIVADLLIMVNWPHSLPWSEVISSTLSLTKALSLKYLIIDTIAPGTPGYPYHHSLTDLQCLGDVIQSKLSIDGVRTLHVISLNAS